MSSSNCMRAVLRLSRALSNQAAVQGGYSTVVSDVVWGVAVGGIDNRPNADDGDPAGAPVANKLTFDLAFDVATAEGQQLIDDQLEHLRQYTTPPSELYPGALQFFLVTVLYI